MIDPVVRDAILNQLDRLPVELQQRVLQVAESLPRAPSHGVAGKDLLRFRGTITEEDATAMTAAIDTACEQVDVHEWSVPGGGKR